MADRLQKTLDVRPSVASVGKPLAPADTSLARTISTVGELAGEAILTRRKGDLEDNLRDLGEEVFAAKEGRDLEEATERFGRLKKAKDQGVLSDSMVNIEAEKILKQKIGINSAFAPELRREAARILGFDPSGSEIQALFGKSGKSAPSRPLTEGEKDMQRATLIGDTLGIPADNIFTTIQKAKLGKIMVDNQTSLAQIGQSSSKAIFNAKLFDIDSDVSDAVGEVLSTIQQGGVVSPELMSGQFQQAKQRQWVAFRGALTDGGIIPSAEDLAGFRKEMDAEWQPLFDMIDSGTMESILKRQKDSLTSLAGIQGVRLFPGLAAINQGLGQAGVQEFLRLSAQFQDESQQELFKRMSPKYAAVADNRTEAYKAMLGGYNRVMGLAPIDETADTGLDDGIRRNLIKTVDEPTNREKVLQSLRQRGQAFKDFGDYAQPGARAKAIPEEVTHVRELWGVTFEPLVARVASELKADKDVKLTVSNGRLTARVDPLAVSGQARAGQFAATTSISSRLEADIKRLNGMNKLIQNGWASDVDENTFGFLERTVNKIGTLQADSEDQNATDTTADAFSAFRQNPSPENLESLRSIAPDLVAEAERRAAERGVQANAE